MSVFLACQAAVGEKGRDLGEAMYDVNIKANLYLSQAYDDGAIGQDGRLYYNNYMVGNNVIRWDLPIPVLYIHGVTKTITNKKPFGYVKFSQDTPEGANLGSDKMHDGNLHIDGHSGTIKEVGK